MIFCFFLSSKIEKKFWGGLGEREKEVGGERVW